MKKKYTLLALCATMALCAAPFVLTGCDQTKDTANNAVPTETADTVFGDWITVTAATCEEAGVEMRVSLTNAQVTETRAIPAKGHDWNEWQTVTEPTCLLAGVETRTCNTCENSDKRAIPALGHDWDEWETLREADCLCDGARRRVCLRDGKHTESEKIAALGHDWSDWVITRAPTCTASGVETRYCRNCNNHTELRKVEAYGHDWNRVVTKAPTCTEDGEESLICTHDASHYRLVKVNKLGHSYSDWIVSVPATETEEGEEMRVCRNDASHTETRVLPPAGSEGLVFKLNEAGTEYSLARANSGGVRTTIYIPDTYNGLPVTEILSGAFEPYCKNVEHIVFLGNNMRTINPRALRLLDNLQSFDFPEGMTEINLHSIMYCTNLKSISIPASAVSIVNYLYYCSSLENITVAEGNPVYQSEGNCLIERATNKVILGTTKSEIPQTVTTIGRRAFQHLNIESVYIPASVTQIEYGAFLYCQKLNSVTFAEDSELSVIGESAFYVCDHLQSIVLPKNVTEIGNTAFLNCLSLRELVLNENLKNIGYYAFRACISIETIIIPVNVEYLSYKVFASWTEGQTIIIKGFASEEEADAAWHENWREQIVGATIVYEG